MSLQSIILIPDCDLPRIRDTAPLAVLTITAMKIKKKTISFKYLKIRPFNFIFNFLESWNGICLYNSLTATWNVCYPGLCFENTRGSFTTQINKQRDEWKYCSIESPSLIKYLSHTSAWSTQTRLYSNVASGTLIIFQVSPKKENSYNLQTYRGADGWWQTLSALLAACLPSSEQGLIIIPLKRAAERLD